MKPLLLALILLPVLTLTGSGQSALFGNTFDELVLAITELRTKKGSPAMINLACKGTPVSSAVYTEGDGKLYLLIFRESKVGQIGSWKSFEEDMGKQNAHIKAELRPRIDRANRRIVNYSEASWRRILNSLQKYPAMDKKILAAFLLRAQAHNVPQAAYVVPKGNEKRLLESLIVEGWGIEREAIRCRVPQITKKRAGQAGGDKPATGEGPKPENSEKTNPDSEGGPE